MSILEWRAADGLASSGFVLKIHGDAGKV